MNSDDPELNGQALFFHNFVKQHANVVFDIGCEASTFLTRFEKEVHYFNPYKKMMNILSKQKNKNSRSVFNRFGLADIDKELDFYTDYNSFVDHYKSNDIFPSEDSIKLPVRSAKNYMVENHIQKVDFVKVDVNGFEFSVIKGFGDFLQSRVHILQFHYNKHFYDADTKLAQVIQYLHNLGFYNFSYISPNGLVDVKSLHDTYENRHIVCLNKNFTH